MPEVEDGLERDETTGKRVHYVLSFSLFRRCDISRQGEGQKWGSITPPTSVTEFISMGMRTFHTSKKKKDSSKTVFSHIFRVSGGKSSGVGRFLKGIVNVTIPLLF